MVHKGQTYLSMAFLVSQLLCIGTVLTTTLTHTHTLTCTCKVLTSAHMGRETYDTLFEVLFAIWYVTQGKQYATNT